VCQSSTNVGEEAPKQTLVRLDLHFTIVLLLRTQSSSTSGGPGRLQRQTASTSAVYTVDTTTDVSEEYQKLALRLEPLSKDPSTSDSEKADVYMLGLQHALLAT